MSISREQPLTLNAVLRSRAIESAAVRGYSFLVDGEQDVRDITYGELDRRARALAAELCAACPPGVPVLVLHPPGIGFLVAFFACLYAGLPAIPAYPPRSRGTRARVDAILRDARPAVVLSDAQADEGLAPLTIVTDADAACPATDWQPLTPDPAAPALIQYTSGSTSSPRGVIVTHANLMHNQGVIARAFAHDERSRIVSWLPVYHDMGLTNVLQALYAGVPCVWMAPRHFLQRPARWLEAIGRHGATTSGGPNFAFAYCVEKIGPEARRGLDLSTWRVAYNGSEPVRAGTLRRFAEAFAPCGFRSSSFRPCYGLAEATLMVACGGIDAPYGVHRVDPEALQRGVASPPARTDPEGPARELVGCGAATGCRVAIVDAHATELAEGHVGEIWVAGPSVAAGYWERPDETASTFGARLANTAEGPFLRTGDLGLVRAGELVVVGRRKDLILLRGHNHHPHDLEQTVERCDRSLVAGGGAAFAVDAEDEERLVLVHEVRTARAGDLERLMRTIRHQILDEHAVQVHAIVLIRPATLPRTTSGKVRRGRTRELFLAGELAVAAQWRTAPADAIDPSSAPPTLASIHAWLLAALAARLGVDPAALAADRPLAHHPVDSLAAVELADQVGVRFGVELPISSFFGDDSVAALAARVLAQTGAAACADRPARDDATLAAHAPATEGRVSRTQRARWLLAQMTASERASNVVARSAQLVGPLDAAALRRSLDRLVDRHPALRTTFAAAGGELTSTLHGRLAPEFVEHDAHDRSDEQLAGQLEALAQRPFDLERGPLLRVHLLRRDAGRHVLLWAAHHIAVDLWSLELLLREWSELYADERGAPSTLPALRRSYEDYRRSHEAHLAATQASHGAYWASHLAAPLEASTIPGDWRPAPADLRRGAAVGFTVSGADTRKLAALMTATGITPFMLVLSALQLLLYHHTGQEHPIVGTPAAGWNRHRYRDVAGCFVNPVAIQGDLSGDPTLRELLTRVRQAVVGALEHQAYPFDAVVSQLRPERRPGRPPLFDVLLIWIEAHTPAGRQLVPFALDEPGGRLPFGDLVLTSLPLRSRPLLCDLELSVGMVGEEMHAVLAYDADLFESSTAARVAAHLTNLLRLLPDAMERPISAVSPLAADERRELLAASVPAGDQRRGRLDELFEARAAACPRAVAIACAGATITYAELSARSTRLADRLRRSGAGGRPIAIATDEGPPQVIAMLAILKAGAPFVCVDLRRAPDRALRILTDVAPSHVITARALADDLGAAASALPIIALPYADDGAEPTTAPLAPTDPEAPAYIVYTSGSSGGPKGIVQSHGSFAQFLGWQIARFEMGPPQRVAQWANITYDAAYCEIFGALLGGATLCMAGVETRHDPEALLDWVEREAITLLQVTPSFCRQMFACLAVRPGFDPLRSVAWMLLAGEAVPVELARSWLARYPQRPALFNLYGPSEAVLATCHAVVSVPERTRSIPIGRPFAGRGIVLLDRRGQLSPTGAIGEIHVRSRHLTLGYHERPTDTARAFVAVPFAAEPGERMYRTGDRGRWLPGGALEFCGRLDDQVKISGVRVELAEVEAVLRAQASVGDCAVVARDDGAGDPRTVAYIVAREALDLAALRRACRRALPLQAVPSAFVRLDALPRNRNGKLDRRALPPPDDAAFGGEADVAALGTDTERRVAGVWREVLGLAEIGAHQSFFELGGHSLTAMQVIHRLRQRCGVELPLALMFDAPTVAGLAAQIDARSRADGPQIARLLREVQALSDAEVEALLQRSEDN